MAKKKQPAWKDPDSKQSQKEWREGFKATTMVFTALDCCTVDHSKLCMCNGCCALAAARILRAHLSALLGNPPEVVLEEDFEDE